MNDLVKAAKKAFQLIPKNTIKWKLILEVERLRAENAELQQKLAQSYPRTLGQGRRN